MFGLGLWEILAIAVAALVLVRPQDLPRILGRLGRGYGKLLRLRDRAMQTARSLESEIRATQELNERDGKQGRHQAEERNGNQGRDQAEERNGNQGWDELPDGSAELYRRLHEAEQGDGRGDGRGAERGQAIRNGSATTSQEGEGIR